MEEYSKLLAKIGQGSRELTYLFETYFFEKSIQKIRKKRDEEVGQIISKIENLLRTDRFAANIKDKKYEEMRKLDKINKPRYLNELLKAAQRLNRDRRACYL